MLTRHWERTGEQPTALAQSPALPPHLVLPFEAFNFLSRFRPWREGVPEPIMFSEIKTNLEMSGHFNSDEILELCQLVNTLDMEYIAHHAQKVKDDIERTRKKNSKNTR